MTIDVQADTVERAGGGFPDVVDFDLPVADCAFAVEGVAQEGAGEVLVAIELVIGS